MENKITGPDGSEIFLNKSKLKERGWTESMINKLLIHADKEVNNPIYRNSSTMKLYSIVRIEAAESSESFVAYKLRAEKRSNTMKKISNQKKEALLEKINSMKFVINIIPVESLMNRAIKNYNDFHEEKAIQYGNFEYNSADKYSDQNFLNRIMVNYVRHNLTEYDKELEKLAGKIGVHEGIIKIKCMTLEEISKSYPDLKNECRNQIRRVKEPYNYFI